MRWSAIGLSTILAVGPACTATSSATKGPEAAPSSAAARPAPELRPPDWLPVQAREMLQARMQRHGEEMMYLAAMVLTINYEGAAHIAQHIAEEPRIGRPTPDDQGTISELLPGRFFDLQDELNVRAKAVAEAARTQAKDKLVEAYGRLTETCVNCHAVYLQKDPEGLGESGAFDAYPDGPDAEPIERE